MASTVTSPARVAAGLVDHVDCVAASDTGSLISHAPKKQSRGRARRIDFVAINVALNPAGADRRARSFRINLRWKMVRSAKMASGRKPSYSAGRITTAPRSPLA
jgi:hypothetical protein